MNFGENIKRFRKAAGYSRKEAAEKLGVAVPTLAHWENNENEVNNKYLTKMKDLYGVTIAEMFDEEPNVPLSKESKDDMLDKVLDLCDLDGVKSIDDLDENDFAMVKALLNKLIEKKKAPTD